MTEYKYSGAKALVELHALHLREFLGVWRSAKTAGVQLPDTSDTDYDSLEHVLRHTLGAAAGYMNWICRKLELPNPGIKRAPGIDTIEAQAEAYVEHVLERWQEPLVEVEQSKFEPKTYASTWGTHFCIDAMLEHAVMHPIRHSHQLNRLMGQ
ncbi:MAG: hypothetical protein P1V35_11910 [Planctomycetota bacterium]|nr:hypothetical protein [Planctomycetota bacterium]